jgi:hypothetical protein
METSALIERGLEWQRFLEETMEIHQIQLLEKHQRSGRPLGSVGFVRELEN